MIQYFNTRDQTAHNCTTTLLERIGVTTPYFALENVVSYGDGQLLAYAQPELPFGREVGPMSSADIGRHGAIAGLSAVALKRSDAARTFYLASHAEYRALSETIAEPRSLLFDAQVTALDKRQASAIITAYCYDLAVAELTVGYTLFPEKLFGRMFKSVRQVTEPSRSYNGTLDGKLTLDGTCARLVVPSLPASVGDGHFPNYPALPVATMFSQFTHLAGELLAAPFRVQHVVAQAQDLIFAGSEAVFEVERQGAERFNCRALSGGMLKGEVTLYVTGLSTGQIERKWLPVRE